MLVPRPSAAAAAPRSGTWAPSQYGTLTLLVSPGHAAAVQATRQPPLSFPSPEPIGLPPGPASETVVELSPRGRHKYEPMKPWSCHHIVAWLALVAAFLALVMTGVVLYRDHHHEPDRDWEKRAAPLEVAPERPHENYVKFRFESKTTGLTRWPEKGVIADLRLEDIVATRLCCVVGPEEYLVCDSSQRLSSNLGIAYVVRNVKVISFSVLSLSPWPCLHVSHCPLCTCELQEESGAHLLIAAPSGDMSMADCTFSWQTRIQEHDKAALVAPRSSKLSHVHAGRNRQ